MNNFSDIAGNEAVKGFLKNSIKNDKIPHAIILEGLSGMGKSMLANAWAKTLQCEAGGVTSCGKCLSCMSFDSGNHPDVFYTVPEKTKQLGIDAVREQIIRQMETRPYKYKYKVFIIDEAPGITAAAQSALLKTIEEPAGYGIFVFLTHKKYNLLPTILSRCVSLKLRPLSDSLISETLVRRLQISETEASEIASAAHGSLGRALRSAQSGAFTEQRGVALSIIEAAHSGDMIACFKKAKELDSEKERIHEVLAVLLAMYRAEMLNSLGEPHKLLYDIDAVLTAGNQLKRNGSFQLVLEAMLLKLGGFAA